MTDDSSPKEQGWLATIERLTLAAACVALSGVGIVEGWQVFAEWVGNSQDELKEFAGPAARAADLINAIADAFWTLIDAIQSIPDLPGWFGDQLSIGGGAPRRRGGTIERNGTVTVNVQGGSPEAIERAVRDAVRTTARRG